MSKKLYFLIFFLFSTIFYGYCEKHLVLNFSNGETKSINLQEIKNITLANGSLAVNSFDGTSETASFTSLAKITFSGNFSAISDIEAGTNNPAVSLQGDVLEISGLNGTQSVDVFSTAGMRVISTTITDNGSLSVSELPSGVYIVKIESQTFKFIKR